MIGEQASLIIPKNNTNSKLSIFPNPANGNTTIFIDNISPEKNLEVSLVNVLEQRF